MGTSSMIAIKNEDGSVTASYCHYDGYVGYNGMMLKECYNTQELASAVANSGYVSALNEDLQDSIDKSANVDNPVVYECSDEYLLTGWEYCGAQFLYLWDGEQWLYSSLKNHGWNDIVYEYPLALEEA